MTEYIERDAAIAYIRERSEECQKAFEELGGESGIYADAYNDLAEDFYRIPAADVAPVVHCGTCLYSRFDKSGTAWCCKLLGLNVSPDEFCSRGERRNT